MTIADDYRSLSDDQKVKFLFGLENAFNEETVGLLITVLDDQGEYDLARVEATKVLGLGAAAAPDQRTKRKVALKLISVAKFDPAVSRPASPMLRQRLEFAGTIADGAERWLGVKDMGKALASKKTLRAVKHLKEHWRDSAPARLRLSQLALFGVSSEHEGALTLLAWEGRSAKEPKVVRYSGQHEHVFKDLDGFLKWAASEGAAESSQSERR